MDCKKEFDKNRINIYVPNDLLSKYKIVKEKLKEKDSSISNEIQNLIERLYSELK